MSDFKKQQHLTTNAPRLYTCEANMLLYVCSHGLTKKQQQQPATKSKNTCSHKDLCISVF